MRNAVTESIRQQTDEQIIDATLTLLQSQSYDQLAVTEITREAGVSRMAFYRHFGTKEAVIDAIVNQLTHEFRVETEGMPLTSQAIAHSFLVFIKANGMIIAVLLNAGLREQFYPPLRDILQTLYVELFTQEFESEDADRVSGLQSIDYVADFTASGMLALAIRWIATGMRESIDEMSVIAEQMTEANH
ncbi:TetR/AcrR family transcriptional regulator [Weissella minor]|uniref:TetR/AcrR family transcriptional regulator n=1 Tax=Weissella minor TaxID=1620 RepID=UPI001BB06763|nr:TetR/AcrR family transcriptional regulator [Weissella minor]MBS0949153.1 TetR/AcrR family transcriptional regulator [Weissella minor]